MMIMTEPPSASSEPEPKVMPPASTTSGHSGNGNNTSVMANNLTWEKLSPSEFQQLQDFAACKFQTSISLIVISVGNF